MIIIRFDIAFNSILFLDTRRAADYDKPLFMQQGVVFASSAGGF